MGPPQDSNKTRDNFIRDLKNLKTSIQEIEHKTPTTCNDVHATLARDPKVNQDGDTKTDEMTNGDTLHGYNHQYARDAETVNHLQQDPPERQHTGSIETPLTADPNDTTTVPTTQTPSLFKLPDFREHHENKRTLMTKSIAPFKIAIRRIENLLQKITATKDTAQRYDHAQD